MKLMMRITFVLLVMCAFAAQMPAAASAQVVDGVGPVAASATPNGMDFDPPCVFAATLPWEYFYLNSATDMFSIPDGSDGAILDECGNFGVTGQSSPNFLAFNCSAGSSLPQSFIFLNSMKSRVSMNVGSSGNAGSTATLTAFNGIGAPFTSQSVTLTPALQTLTVAGNANIKALLLTGPCVMVVDDIVYQ